MRATLCVVLASAVGLTGCYNAKIRTAAHPDGPRYVDTGVSLFWGASNSTTLAIECPHGLAYAETYHPWWGNFIVAPLTLGIVVPIRKVWVCASKQGSSQNVTRDGDDDEPAPPKKKRKKPAPEPEDD